MNLGDEMMVRLLAQQDALWKPFRAPATPLNGILWEKRQAWSGQGLPWTSVSNDATGQKQEQRTLQKMATDGLVEVYRARVKSVAARLTDKGDQAARRLCQLPTMKQAMALLWEVAAMRDELGFVEGVGAGEWLPECLFARVHWGEEGGEYLVWRLEFLALPLLVRGLLDSNATIAGHVYYSLTKAGAALLKGRKGVVPALPKVTSAVEAYSDLRWEFFERMKNAKERTGEIGPLYIPLCGWGEEFQRKYEAKMAALGVKVEWADDD